MGEVHLNDYLGAPIKDVNPLPQRQGHNTLISIFNRAHPGASTGIIADYAGAILSSFARDSTTLRCNLCLSASGVISYTRKNGANTKTGLLFGGASVAAGVDMPFEIPVEDGDGIDIFHSAAAGTINWLIVREV
jgi:hypothetical protein